MAKKAKKKAVSRSAKGVKSGRSGNNKDVGKRAARATAKSASRTVNVGLFGMAKVVKMVHDAGLESDLNDTLGSKAKIVQVKRKSFKKLKSFVSSKSEFANHPVAMELSDCDPDDEFSICFGNHSSFSG